MTPSGKGQRLRRSKQLLLLRLGLSLRFGKGFDTVGGVFELLARRQIGNRQDLQARVAHTSPLFLIYPRLRESLIPFRGGREHRSLDVWGRSPA